MSVENREGGNSFSSLGGGIRPELLIGSQTGAVEKSHLIINRVLRQEATNMEVVYIDMGTDYHYPFYEDYLPTKQALAELATHPELALHYPSSYGLSELRVAFKDFMGRQFDVLLDQDNEIMVNTGATQAFDALSRAFNGKYVILPSLSLPTVATVATGNGASLLRLPEDPESGFFNVNALDETLNAIDSVRFLYLNSPSNPTGKIASRNYLEKLVGIALKHNILIAHDMDSWYTHHQKNQSAVNILEIPQARNCSITILSLSKEFGLAGLRVGLLAGNANIINVIKNHNSIFGVMVPEVCQLAATAAFESFDSHYQKPEINARVTALASKSIENWKRLGWPDEAIHRPEGGFKFLVEVPPNIQDENGHSKLDLLNYYIAKNCYVKLSGSRSFNPEDDRFIRLVIMQDEAMINEAFERMKIIGIHYTMVLPQGLANEYEAFLDKYVKSDF